MKANVIAIIPARSGSKSIKNKNIVKLKNKPLLAWSIETCLKSNLINKVFVSTDSKKYASIAKKYGVDQVIMRPRKISSDNASDYSMINHAIQNIGINYNIIVHIRPTTPLRNVNNINQAIKKFSNSTFSSLRSVHEMSETSYKSFEVYKKKFLKPLKNIKLNFNQLNLARQKFPKTYIANGVIDIYRKEYILKNKCLHGKKVMAFITQPTKEIDTKEDLDYVRFLVKKNEKKNN